jgi:hypothetical protein
VRLFFAILFLVCSVLAFGQTKQWTPAAADEWYARQPWLVGSNYVPGNAVNQIEMWQAATFDPGRIDMELGWAEDLGMNTMRVFLHDLLWQHDQSGFRHRIDKFLSIAKKHHIRPIFVLFDSCWNPFPSIDRQRPPKPGVHNSEWVQSPGARALSDPQQYDRILNYIQDVILAFNDDSRILAWDGWNEPDNTNANSYGKVEVPNKVELVEKLLPLVFKYARAGLPKQPLTSGVWHGDWSSPDKLTPIEKTQIELSDLVSFHNYGPPRDFEQRVKWLQQYHRPILCTEYMARPLGSTFEAILPIARKYNVAAINWGFAAGKTQTYLPWDSWQKPYPPGMPQVWFHDIFFGNGAPYSQAEVNFIRSMTSRKLKARAASR